MKQTERIVKVYLKLKDNPGGGWGPLIQKMFGEMILAKKLGKGDGASLRANCQLALELIGEGDGATEAMVDQLAKAKPYSDFWTLTKRTTKAILCLLKGNGTESERQRSTEDILRMLKTFAEDGESLKMVQKGGKREADKAGVIRDSRYRKISNSRLPPPVHGKGKNRRRRRKRQLTILVLFGIILAGVAICAMICKLFAKKGSAEG